MVKILLVDDDEMNRDRLGRRLARRGYTVTCLVSDLRGFMALSERLVPVGDLKLQLIDRDDREIPGDL
jgi:ActR/RegA family two-component response regulator